MTQDPATGNLDFSDYCGQRIKIRLAKNVGDILQNWLFPSKGILCYSNGKEEYYQNGA